MITGNLIKSLTEDEYALLLYCFNHVVEKYGTTDALKWVRRDVAVRTLISQKELLKEDHQPLVASIVEKLNNNG